MPIINSVLKIMTERHRFWRPLPPCPYITSLQPPTIHTLILWWHALCYALWYLDPYLLWPHSTSSMSWKQVTHTLHTFHSFQSTHRTHLTPQLTALFSSWSLFINKRQSVLVAGLPCLRDTPHSPCFFFKISLQNGFLYLDENS